MELNIESTWRAASSKTKSLGIDPDGFVDVVEVSWNDKIERVVFLLPVAQGFWKSSSKTAFLETVDLSSVEKRMGQLFASIDG